MGWWWWRARARVRACVRACSPRHARTPARSLPKREKRHRKAHAAAGRPAASLLHSQPPRFGAGLPAGPPAGRLRGACRSLPVDAEGGPAAPGRALAFFPTLQDYCPKHHRLQCSSPRVPPAITAGYAQCRPSFEGGRVGGRAAPAEVPAGISGGVTVPRVECQHSELSLKLVPAILKTFIEKCFQARCLSSITGYPQSLTGGQVRRALQRTTMVGETALPASGPRPVRVHFFGLYRAARVRSASSPRPLSFLPGCTQSSCLGKQATARAFGAGTP
eukprot:gene22467-biopygen1175